MNFAILLNVSPIQRIRSLIGYSFLTIFALTTFGFAADYCGKIDFGPTFLHIDVLESGHTIKKINMAAVKADGSFLVWQGLCLKPTLIYARQGHSEIISGGCGIGHYTPIGEKCSLTPSIGCNFTQFKTTLHYLMPAFSLDLPAFTLDLKERFRSISPYVGLDTSYCFAKGWRLIAAYQYAWSRSHTAIKGFKDTKSNPKGSNYGLAIEGDLNDSWSVNIAAAYNTSLTKEKHGLRGYGVRFGIAYWF